MGIRVYVEAGSRRTFACALDWPGWCRSGKDEPAALAALAAYADRYRPIARAAGFELPDDVRAEVVERVPGSATTVFGAPASPAGADSLPLQPGEEDRLRALLEASRRAFESAAAAAPAELRKGPRGGGRDTEEIRAHVAAADAAYWRKQGWPLPYRIRRAAWHLLDHAWEIEDKS